jgi:DNA-binding NarL/FixJ family response regulator
LTYLRNMEKVPKQTSRSGYKQKQTSISLMIVEDHPVVVEGLQLMFNSTDRFLVEGIAGTAKECLRLLQYITPDVILLDINLPDISGIELCKIIIDRYPALKVIALTTFNERVFIQQMLDNGAYGYVLKNASSDEIMEGVAEVSKGNKYLCHETENLLKKTQENELMITRRENSVLKLLAEGYTNLEIADKLFISPLTVDSHRKNLILKLQARNTASLIKIASDKGLL